MTEELKRRSNRILEKIKRDSALMTREEKKAKLQQFGIFDETGHLAKQYRMGEA